MASFSEPVHIGAHEYVDGELGANNRVDKVVGEASNLWCPRTGDLKLLVKCFVSIGPGNLGKKVAEGNVLRLLSNTLVAIATEAGGNDRQVYGAMATRVQRETLLPLQCLEEYQDQGTIEAAMDDCLEQQEQKFQLRECARNLEQKQSLYIGRFVLVERVWVIALDRSRLSSATDFAAS
ncbi:MAG: hypothetical protein M1840_001792 [Geoglossum simile]|nr:MAG: hypothetical protein M1840_001792 [Geoglossum simile]